MEESFVLLSLKEKQSQDLAQVISNQTSRKILDYLANKEFATESQVSTDLKIPPSTAHYNLQALKKSGLVVDKEFHYSEKGKEVPHYKLAKKYIIIAPRGDVSILERLKGLLPIGLLAVAATIIITLMQNRPAAPLLMKSADMAFAMAENAPASAPVSPVGIWFFAGALFAILAVAAFEFVKKK